MSGNNNLIEKIKGVLFFMWGMSETFGDGWDNFCIKMGWKSPPQDKKDTNTQ